MFEKKQVIYSETQGVCRVDNIVSLSAARGEPGVPYYVLRSVFDKEKVAYIPVDNHQVMLRELFSEEEARALEQDSEALAKDERLKEAVDYVLHKED
ncbi:MAG: CarD family transcriptional regulator [Muribaculaceae bacterium]|nr:CarD family transcriptional regulator [Roseburia sp.]MCM1429923.1 CarD family transcriptional regulator [Muribaculaceae bacterium]MCM1493050.1 CarD family transcriptional regulator [Muribaculaceae bacterium]